MSTARMSRRDFLRAAVGASAGLLGLSALSACQPAAPAAPAAGGAAPAAEGPTVINVWWWSNPVYEAAVQTFNNVNGKIKVNMSELGEAVFGDQKYLTAVAAGTGPDSALQNRHTFMQFAAKKLYKSLDEYFNRDGYKKEDFTPVQLAESSWDGVIYGIPWVTDTRHLFYNVNHLEEAGFAAPPTTWAETEEYTVKLTKKKDNGDIEVLGFAPYALGNSWMWMYGFLNKAPAISEDKRTILCDDPRWVYALEWITSIYDKHMGISFEQVSAFDQGFTTQTQDLFIQQKVSMIITGDWMLNTYSRFPDLNWAMVPAPIPPEGEKSSWSCGWGFVIAPESKHPEEAWEWIKWITGVEGWRAVAEGNLAETKKQWEREQIPGEPIFVPSEACYLPAVAMLEKEFVAKLPEKLQKEYELGIDCLKNWTHGCGTEMGLAALTYWVEMDNAARNALSHKLSAADAMKQCKEKVQKATDEAWAALDQA